MGSSDPVQTPLLTHLGTACGRPGGACVHRWWTALWIRWTTVQHPPADRHRRHARVVDVENVEPGPRRGRPNGWMDRRILALALPALGALVAEPLFVLVDSAVVGRLGTAPLAGLAFASTVLLTPAGLGVFLAYATTAAVARRLGAGYRRPSLRAAAGRVGAGGWP